jgi:hypothetical protein
MAYVPGFEHDIFISYARENDDRLEGNGEGWVTQFTKHLESKVLQLLGARDLLKVWKDDLGGIAGNAILDQTIFSAVKSSAVMVAVVSPGYLERKWCREELDAFCNSNSQDIQVGNKLRLFKVVLIPVELDRQIGDLKRVTGYEFSDKEPSDEFVPIYWPRGLLSNDQRFWIRLSQLADEISECLRLLREKKQDKPSSMGSKSDLGVQHETARGVRIQSGGTIGRTVYLAQATEDLLDEWQELKDELEQNQFRVLPANPLPNFRDDLRADVEKMLSESVFSVHIFGKSYGLGLVDDPSRSISHLQYELAHRWSMETKSRFPRIGWLKDVPQIAAVKSSQQKEFLELLEKEADTDPPLDLQRGSIERLKETLRAFATKSEPTLSEPVRKALIYVTGQRDDLESSDAKALIAYLKGRRHDVFWPASAADDSKREKQDAMYMEQSDGLVILYGQAPADWVQEKAFDARRRSQRRRKQPLTAAVYDAPPPQKEELPFQFEEVPILNGRLGLQVPEVRKFLDRIENLSPETGQEAES